MDTLSLGPYTTSRIAYGCMTLGTLDDDVAVAGALDAALNGGVTLFDHADIYAGGRSEEVFGRYLAARPGVRDRLTLQTKCGIRFADDPEGAPKRYDASYEHIVRSTEGSLRRLGVEHVEVLMLHRPDPLMEPEEVARAFSDLHAAGKVGAFGVSNFSVAQIDRLSAALDRPLVCNQVQLSLAHLGPVEAGVTVDMPGQATGADGLLDGCATRGVRVQAWSPLAGGAFFQPDATAHATETADVIAETARTHGADPLSVVLAWVLRLPHGVQPVVGTTNPARIEACCAAAGVELSRAEWFALYQAARGHRIP